MNTSRHDSRPAGERRPYRHDEIEQALRDRIDGLSAGDPLPTDAMLCDEFGVSRMTARNAVQRLVQEGLVYRVRGHGTFVAERRAAEDGPSATVERVNRLLRGLAEAYEASAPQLAALLGDALQDTHELLAALERAELIERGLRPGSYRLGLGLLRLGSTVVARFDERQAALPIMEQLHQETEETVYLCVRRGRDAVCIERIDGLWVQSMALRLGGSLPLHAGAAPRALLAYEPRSYWEEYVAAGELERRTPATPTARDELFAALERVLATGCSVSDEDVVSGIASVGAPVFDHRGTIRAAISFGGQRSNILGAHEAASIRLIVDAAAEVSRSLGFIAPVSQLRSRSRGDPARASDSHEPQPTARSEERGPT